MNYFVDVIIPIPLEKLFTYSITPAEASVLKPGIRVAVPFGKSKIYTGIIHHIHQNEPLIYEAKDIYQILDQDPIVNSTQLKHWEWISEYYMCTLGDVMRAALPNPFILESETVITKSKNQNINDEDLKDDEFLIYEALHNQSSLKIQDVINILEKKTVLPVIQSLIDKRVIIVEEEIFEKYKPKLVRYVKLNDQYDSNKGLEMLLHKLKRAKKQSDIVLNYFLLSGSHKKPVKVSELIEKSTASSTQIKALIDKSIFEELMIQEDRVRFETIEEQPNITLNKHQINCLNKVNESFDKQEVVLMHGVTSSGKTEIYIKLINEALLKGKQVLYLVPEIALTSQLVSRLKQFFGNHISVFHSRYSLNERVEVWHHVLNNSDNAKIILGARSSVFLPFKDLDLIIVDEEHEASYKQFDPAPRYHARDTAIIMGKLCNANVLLGSATPSLESYYNATIVKKYALTELKRRYNDVLMPEIELVDLKDKHKRKRMKGHFSDRLIDEMTEALGNKNQIILFQNRRGFSPIVECHTCGHAPQCPNCDVSLTFHQYRDQLRCHYCGYAMAMQKNCMACGNVDLDSKGFGTEQVEEEAKRLFANVEVARMDLDTTKGKYAYEKIITSFEKHDIDILIGTQMLTKGLDFRNVKLVGIMNADNLLNFPDFRAHERSFQMLTQVSGRAGRTEERGQVLIQTYNPYHKILQQVSSNDYSGMFKEQLEQRYAYKYPPFYKLIRITLKHRDFNKVNDGSEWLAKSLRQLFKPNVLGPEFPVIARIRNEHLKNILIKIPQKQSLSKTKEAILKIKNSFSSIKDFRPIKVILNVDYF